MKEVLVLHIIFGLKFVDWYHLEWGALLRIKTQYLSKALKGVEPKNYLLLF